MNSIGWSARAGCAGALVLACLTLAPDALATFSIVALSRESGRFGMATASCVPISTLERIHAVVPGRGAVLAQSFLIEEDRGRRTAEQLLNDGRSAADVLKALLDPSFDPDFQLRQYVVLDAEGGAVSHTGDEALPYADSILATDAMWVVGAAGNVLTGRGVLTEAQRGFADGPCDFEGRLVAGLLVAGASGLGDSRCVGEGRPAQSAWLRVEQEEGPPLDIRVEAAAGDDPFDAVSSQFTIWRETHACEAPTAEPDPGPPELPVGCAVASSRQSPRHGAPRTAWLGLLVGMFLGRRRARK